jgi:hypothetical protein
MGIPKGHESGGRSFKSSGGKVNILGSGSGKGIPKAGLPSVSEKKIGQSNYLGCGGDKGISKKSSGGSSKAPLD